MTEPLTPSPLDFPPSLHTDDRLVQDNVRSLLEAVDVLESLPPAEYAADSRYGSTVGAHFRHVLDHYLCLLEGLDSGLVHYEGRRRDPVVEVDRGVATALARALAAHLEHLTPATLLRPLRIRCLAGELAEQHLGDHPTTPHRELHFVLLHAVHHYSVIALELKTRGYMPPPEFGVAPATRGWRRSQS